MAHLLQRQTVPQVRTAFYYPLTATHETPLLYSHASHHLLAIYAMAADGELLKAAYETHVVYQKPAFPPPEDKKISKIIDDSNWKDHLGDER